MAVRVRAKPSFGPSTRSPRPSYPQARTQTVITVLTGRRPELLRKTLSSLEARAPLLVEQAQVVVLVNGADAPTLSVVEQFAWANKVVSTEEFLPIGPAFSRLVRLAECVEPTPKYFLHLEDDWQCCREEPKWFDRAVHCIEQHGVGQVRLRLAKAMTMRVNALTHQPIRWQKQGNRVRVSSNAHFTFNPSLVSARVMRQIVPCASEFEAMERYGSKKVAQLVPGSFFHIGDQASLAEKTKPPSVPKRAGWRRGQ